MHDPVSDVLRQRAALGTGASAGIAVSLVLHGGMIALAIYAALHATPPAPVSTLSIRLAQAKAPAITSPKPITPPAAKPIAPRIEPPKPEPAKVDPAKPVEKNTVPLSPFGRSTQKGSENPETRPKTDTTAPATATSTAPVVPVGGSGVTGLEGGDFPFTLYINGMQRAIQKNWLRPQIGGDLTVVIRFRILRDGTITDTDYVTRSGNPTFDRQALSAVRSSSPLSPLPYAYNGTYLGVNLTFR
jgi:periplasmic protein TonB